MSIFDRFRLNGKRLFITGGSRGLGREMALAIADAGADVILVGRDGHSLDHTATDIRQLGREAFTIQGNVCDTAECQTICQRAWDEFAAPGAPYRSAHRSFVLARLSAATASRSRAAAGH